MNALLVTGSKERTILDQTGSESTASGDLRSRTVTHNPQRDTQILWAYQAAMENLYITVAAGSVLMQAEVLTLMSNINPWLKAAIAVGGPLAMYCGLRALDVLH